MPLNNRDFFFSILVKFEVTPQFQERSTNLYPSTGGIFFSILVHFEEWWVTVGCWGLLGMALEDRHQVAGHLWDRSCPSAVDLS